MTQLSDSRTAIRHGVGLVGHVPVAVQTRGPLIESTHYGSVVVTAADGTSTLTAGDPGAPFYARSALKPLQAVAMVRHGLTLTDDLLALAASSHSGSPQHVEGVRQILAKHPVDEDLLANTPDLPYGAAERAEWIRAGHGPERLPQNCSGKHAAMLATCSVNGWSLEDYLDPGHPLQRAVRETIEELTGHSVMVQSTDGCGAPVHALPLGPVARAYGLLASAAASTPEGEVARAMRAFPEVVSGVGRDVAAAMRAQPGLLAKEGAEGVQLFGLPDGTGVAVKISDGGDRARLPVAIRALQYAGAAQPDLLAIARTPALGGGAPVGTLHALDFAGPAGTLR